MSAPVHPDALIFDLDGTLWDTCLTCADVWNRVLARLGIPYRPITASDVRSVAGQPHPEGVRRVFTGLSEEQIQCISEQTQIEDNLAIARRGGELYPGVREHTPRLRALVPLMIVSNCQRGYIEIFLSTSGLGEHFVDFECWGNTGETKSANLRALIERNRLRCPWFIGDTEGDFEAARDNGVRFIHASYGFGQVERCDHRINRFADLLGDVASQTERSPKRGRA
jgi:phosphoglycolate phosphatase